MTLQQSYMKKNSRQWSQPETCKKKQIFNMDESSIYIKYPVVLWRQQPEPASQGRKSNWNESR